MGLVDLHCHILPGVDDGALDVRDSIAMARHAERDGIDLVCATPHIRSDHDVRIAELPDRIAELNGALERAAVAVRVAPGGEVAEPIVGELTEAELTACSLGGGGRWVLLEPAAGPLGARTVATVEHLAGHGLRAVLAHPERHPGPDLLDTLREVVSRGALVQVTAAFVLDGSADAFAEAGLVHVLASDAHSSHGGRRLELSAALERLAAVPALASHAGWIAREAPRAVVEGRDVAPPF
jgi:protein-tyrosine phosphatase